MGPILLCDKSTLQGLSRAELNLLRRSYSVNVPPVLLMEILADLRKADDLSIGQAEVQRLADKLVPACSYVNVGFRDIVIGELEGFPVPADGRPVLRGGKTVKSGEKVGMIFEQSAEDDALLRWQRGSFLEAETILAGEWRRVAQSIDLEATQRVLRRHYSSYGKLKTFGEVVDLVDQLISSSSPRELVSWFLRDCEILVEPFEKSLSKLATSNTLSVATALPYTMRCIRIALIFHFGLTFGLVSTRATNRIDLEYLYYVPFCMVFSSGDALHGDLVRFISKDQLFIPRDVLKADMKGLLMWWKSLTPAEQEVERRISGPPEFEASPTYQAWKKFMKPGYRARANSEKKMSPDVEGKLMEHIRTTMDGAAPDQALNVDSDECDFIVRKQFVRLNGPCICGSDRLFRDCCGHAIAAELKA